MRVPNTEEKGAELIHRVIVRAFEVVWTKEEYVTVSRPANPNHVPPPRPDGVCHNPMPLKAMSVEVKESTAKILIEHYGFSLAKGGGITNPGMSSNLRRPAP